MELAAQVETLLSELEQQQRDWLRERRRVRRESSYRELALQVNVLTRQVNGAPVVPVGLSSSSSSPSQPASGRRDHEQLSGGELLEMRRVKIALMQQEIKSLQDESRRDVARNGLEQFSEPEPSNQFFM